MFGELDSLTARRAHPEQLRCLLLAFADGPLEGQVLAVRRETEVRSAILPEVSKGIAPVGRCHPDLGLVLVLAPVELALRKQHPLAIGGHGLWRYADHVERVIGGHRPRGRLLRGWLLLGQLLLGECCCSRHQGKCETKERQIEAESESEFGGARQHGGDSPDAVSESRCGERVWCVDPTLLRCAGRSAGGHLPLAADSVQTAVDCRR